MVKVLCILSKIWTYKLVLYCVKCHESSFFRKFPVIIMCILCEESFVFLIFSCIICQIIVFLLYCVFYYITTKGVNIMRLNPDNGFFRFLSLVSDLLMLNVLFIITCLPIVTIGPALTALYSVSLDMIRKRYPTISSSYFKAFKKHFKQGLAIGIINILFAFGFIYNLLYFGFTDGLLSSYMTWLFGALIAILYMVQIFVYNLMARNRASVLELYTNAFIITLAKLPMNVLALGATLIYPFIILMIYFSSII